MASVNSVLTILPGPLVEGPPTNNMMRVAQVTANNAAPVRPAATYIQQH